MTSDEDSGKLHEELVEGHRLYGRLEGDWFIIEQVGSPPPLLAGWTAPSSRTKGRRAPSRALSPEPRLRDAGALIAECRFVLFLTGAAGA
ncbi:MAG TPA: hypothetical protein VKO35_13360, partial [Acidimicrobiia bacterium]|nr:hypothetical protein [Acidimicrobiia bacterium]